jgi:hypothetical protein
MGVLNRSIFFPFHDFQSSLNDLTIQQRLDSLQDGLYQQQNNLQQHLTTSQTQWTTLQDRFTTLESSVQSLLVTLQTLTSHSNSSQPSVPRVMSGRSADDNNVTTSVRGTSAIRARLAATPVRTGARGVGLSRTVANPVKK